MQRKGKFFFNAKERTLSLKQPPWLIIIILLRTLPTQGFSFLWCYAAGICFGKTSLARFLPIRHILSPTRRSQMGSKYCLRYGSGLAFSCSSASLTPAVVEPLSLTPSPPGLLHHIRNGISPQAVECHTAIKLKYNCMD